MLAALRRAGSVLPKHARSRQRELQSRRRCLPAEPGQVPRRLSSKLGALCRQSLRGTPTIKPMVLKVQTYLAANPWP